jgi:hypothetical protein
MNTAKEILDVKGAAQVLGCSVAHVSNMLNGKVDGVPPYTARPRRPSAVDPARGSNALV